MDTKDKLFISYYHGKNYEFNYWHKKEYEYITKFKELCSNIFDVETSSSKKNKKIHIKNSIATIVLVGNETSKQKYINSEIKSNSSQAVISLVLPTYENRKHSFFNEFGRVKLENSNYSIDQNDIPQTIREKTKNGITKIYDWSEDINYLKTLIYNTD